MEMTARPGIAFRDRPGLKPEELLPASGNTHKSVLVLGFRVEVKPKKLLIRRPIVGRFVIARFKEWNFRACSVCRALIEVQMPFPVRIKHFWIGYTGGSRTRASNWSITLRLADEVA